MKKNDPDSSGGNFAGRFQETNGISQYQLAKEMSVYPRKVREIVHGKRSVTADTVLRLACFFSASAEAGINLLNETMVPTQYE